MDKLQYKYSENPNYVCKARINSLIIKLLNIPNLTVKKAKEIFDNNENLCVYEQVGHPYDLTKRRFTKYIKLNDLKTAILESGV